MVTIVDIAKKAGVSRGTVDRVLHDRGRVSQEKAELVKRCAQEMGYQPNIAGRGLAARKKKLRFGFCYMVGRLAPFYIKVYEEAKKYAETLLQYGVEVCFFPINIEEVNDEEMALEFTRQNQMDGWVMSGMFGELYLKCLQQLGMEPVPIVSYNTDIHQRMAHVGCDYVQSGRLACGLAAIMTDNQASIGILSYFATSISSKLRIQGFRQELEEYYPQMNIADTAYFTLQMDEFDVFLTVRNMIEKHPEINVIYFANPGDYAVCRAINKVAEKRKIKVITYDLESEKLIDLIKDGKIDVTIGQEPEKQGRVPLEILFNYLVLGIKPETDWYKTELSIHIKQNI